MSNTVIKVENISKQYRLGQVSTGTISHDVNRWWHRVRGKEDPYLKIGEANDRTVTGSSDYVWALRDINFEVKQGEVLGIIGRNGAGKSTLLKVLSRTTAPTTGSIKIKGRVASLLEVGTGFHPELSGRENIFLNGAILGMNKKEIERKFDEIVDFAGVERYIDTPVKRYSSGMYVRLAFAVAAHLEPEILIVDEVLAVGDAEFQKKCLGKMKDVSVKDGRTVLFVSHNLPAVLTLCNQCIYLKNGAFEIKDQSSKVISIYQNDSNLIIDLPLNQRSDRQGNGKLTFLDCVIDSTDQSGINAVASGETLKLSMQLKNNAYPEVIVNPVFSISISDEHDQVLQLYRSNFDRLDCSIASEFASIECVIDRLPLTEGNYKINVFAGIGETEAYDLVMNAKELIVNDGDYFKNGTKSLPYICKVLTDQKWSIKT